MGKNLKGKECGKGICQRKDGLYTARFVNKRGVRQEQEKFMEVAKRSHNYYQYALLLETGLRTGELVGLTWDAIDWKKRTLTVF